MKPVFSSPCQSQTAPTGALLLLFGLRTDANDDDNNLHDDNDVHNDNTNDNNNATDDNDIKDTNVETSTTTTTMMIKPAATATTVEFRPPRQQQ